MRDTGEQYKGMEFIGIFTRSSLHMEKSVDRNEPPRLLARMARCV